MLRLQDRTVVSRWRHRRQATLHEQLDEDDYQEVEVRHPAITETMVVGDSSENGDKV